MSITMKKLSINDSKKTLSLNESRVIREAQKNEKEKAFRFASDAFLLIERGAEQLHFALGEEGVIDLFEKEITSEFIKERYRLGFDARLYDLMDAAPLYSAIYVDFEMEGDFYQIVLVKETKEEHAATAEFRIPEMRMLFR